MDLQTKHLAWIAAGTGVVAVLSILFWRRQHLQGLGGSIVLPFLKPRKVSKASAASAKTKGRTIPPIPDEDLTLPDEDFIPDEDFVPPDELFPEYAEEAPVAPASTPATTGRKRGSKIIDDPGTKHTDPKVAAHIRHAFDLVLDFADKKLQGKLSPDEADQLCSRKLVYAVTGDKEAAEKHDPVLCESFCLRTFATGGICAQGNDGKSHCVCLGPDFRKSKAHESRPVPPAPGRKQLFLRTKEPKVQPQDTDIDVNEGAE